MTRQVGAEKGDRVEVFLSGDSNVPDVEGIVKYVPVSTGDSWIIETDDGKICHVMHFSLMRVVQKVGSNTTEEEI